MNSLDSYLYRLTRFILCYSILFHIRRYIIHLVAPNIILFDYMLLILSPKWLVLAHMILILTPKWIVSIHMLLILLQKWIVSIHMLLILIPKWIVSITIQFVPHTKIHHSPGIPTCNSLWFYVTHFVNKMNSLDSYINNFVAKMNSLNYYLYLGSNISCVNNNLFCFFICGLQPQ